MSREVGYYVNSVEGIRGPDSVSVQGHNVIVQYRRAPSQYELREVSDTVQVAIDDLVGQEGWQLEVRTAGKLTLRMWLDPLAHPGDNVLLTSALQVRIPAQWSGVWTRMHADAVNGRTLRVSIDESNIEDPSLTSSITVEVFNSLEAMRAAAAALDDLGVGWTRDEAALAVGKHEVSVRRFIGTGGGHAAILTEISFPEGERGVRILRSDRDAGDASSMEMDLKALGRDTLRLLELENQL